MLFLTFWKYRTVVFQLIPIIWFDCAKSIYSLPYYIFLICQFNIFTQTSRGTNKNWTRIKLNLIILSCQRRVTRDKTLIVSIIKCGNDTLITYCCILSWEKLTSISVTGRWQDGAISTPKACLLAHISLFIRIYFIWFLLLWIQNKSKVCRVNYMFTEEMAHELHIYLCEIYAKNYAKYDHDS